jgi:hypothetical protein
MKSCYDPDSLRELAGDIEAELVKLARLEGQIQYVQNEIEQAPQYAELFYENLGLKFHNFYTGCERIFSLIVVEMNGGVPNKADWHRRLLDRMKEARGERRAVITTETAQLIQDFLAFRHVVRNIYGFELDTERLEKLLQKYPQAWHQFERDIQIFVEWLNELAISLDEI